MDALFRLVNVFSTATPVSATKASFQIIWMTVAVWALVYISHLIEFNIFDVTMIWPAGALCLWLLIRYGWIALPPCLLGPELYHWFWMWDSYDYHLLSMTIGNAIAAWVAALLYLKSGGSKYSLSEINDILRFVFIAVFLQSAISALIGSYVLYSYHDLGYSEAQLIFSRWFFSDIAGGILCGPAFIVATLRKSWLKYDAHEGLRIFLVVLLTVGFEYWMLQNQSGLTGQLYPTILLIMPSCLWIAMRPHSASVALALMILIILCLYTTLAEMTELNDQVMVALQMYASVIMVSSLIMHGIMLARNKAYAALEMQNNNLESLVSERTQALQDKVLETEQLAEQLKHLSLTDYLTQLSNRRAFMEAADVELKRLARNQVPLAILVFDIDHFKQLNDRYGHAIGDQYLIRLSQVLSQLVRDGGDYLARLGGEEFACLCSGTDEEGALILAERMRQRAEEIVLMVGTELVKTTISIGIVVCEQPEDNSVETLLMVADEAMYAAKNGGRNRIEVRLV